MESLLQRTRTVVCVGRNYAAHAAELSNAVPKEPFYFLKPVSALLRVPGASNNIEIPPGIGEVHHEAELAVIIGGKDGAARARRVKACDAQSVIAGYAVAVDVTGRDLQAAAKKSGLPWTRAKGYDTWCPIGPVVPRDTVANVGDLVVCLSVNGIERQRGAASLMLFDIPRLIESITDCMTLEPGDVILTGTPAGVGEMRPGDKVKCWIEGLDSPALELGVVQRSGI